MTNQTKVQRFFRLISFLSSGYPKTKDECTTLLGIKDSAFYNYRNTLLESGFDVRQKDGQYWIDYPDQVYQALRNVLHFSEEDCYLLSRCIDMLNENVDAANRLKHKLTVFFNQDKAIEVYIHKEKSALVQVLRKAQKEKKQILLVNYASGNSQTVKNRMVEPFEFKDDFNLVWAFDTALKQNRQFKVCRIENIQESPLPWEYERQHQSKPIDIFRNTGDLNKQIECALSLKARNLLVEEYPLAERYLTPAGKNQYLLRAMVAKYEGPGRFVMGLTEDIQVKGNEGFRNYLKIKINKCTQILSDSTNSGVT
ncbi:MAG: WYL domain-containing protein [Prolixibacteraceae bacterium]